MTIDERNKMSEAARKLEAVRDSLIERKVPDQQYFHLQTIINDINSILALDAARWHRSLKGGENDDDRGKEHSA